MPAAIVLTCVDPRLSHDAVRDQVRLRLESEGFSANEIYVVNEPGGNLGSSFTNTIDLLTKAKIPVVLCAALHHDDCLAARENVRKPLATTASEMAADLAQRGIKCPVLAGNLITDTSALVWLDRPTVSREVFTFRMPRMFGR